MGVTRHVRHLFAAAASFCERLLLFPACMYVDKENYFGGGELDLYNPQGDLFKTQLVWFYPVSIPKTKDVAELLAGPNTDFLINFINKHVTVSPSLRSCVNSDCARKGILTLNMMPALTRS